MQRYDLPIEFGARHDRHGLLLLAGRYEEAHCFIFSYSRCLRHGLIPNLLADDKIARYNSCCSIWWGLCTTSNYINTVPDGDEIFSDIVSRVHPTHNSSTTRQVRVNEERCP
ncbi:unnamed protein product [Rotaria socialis]|uniref:Glycogen debranching enzyme C-terminal domain-containing protein n=1 Tax=Rotaria socialis TaxID=392032 RepID=A0A817UWM9_9BILA|nr:unnamed protein product [Rotaria socialis]